MGERFRVDYLGEMQWGVIDTADGRLVGIDGGEPEDQLLCRDWKWVPEELNKLAATVAAQAERIRELERELVEARQRDEDATDVILRQGRELLEARPKAEAAEEPREVVDECGLLDPAVCRDCGAAVAPPLRCAQCGSSSWREPREVVEPKSAVGLAVEELQRRQVVADLAPAPARYRCVCLKCGWSGPQSETYTYPAANSSRWHMGCGYAVVPVTDAQPGAADGEAGA